MGHQGLTVFRTERAGQSSLRDRIYFYLGVQGSFRPSGTEGPKMSSDLKMKGWGKGEGFQSGGQPSAEKSGTKTAETGQGP